MMADLVVSRSNYAAQRRRSPGAMIAAVALNGGVIALLLAMPAAKFIIEEPGILIGRNIEATKPPPPNQDPVIKKTPIERPVTLTPQADDKPLVIEPILPLNGGPIVDGKTTIDPVISTGTGGTITEPVNPPHVPVFVQTRLDPRYAEDFKPDYPLDMRRLSKEGSVTVRVMVNENGRVVGVELIKASEPSFFEAAKRQALSRWRFLPATRDGKTVGSALTLTLTFRLEDW